MQDQSITATGQEPSRRICVATMPADLTADPRGDDHYDIHLLFLFADSVEPSAMCWFRKNWMTIIVGQANTSLA
jgi:hypothetical protein